MFLLAKVIFNTHTAHVCMIMQPLAIELVPQVSLLYENILIVHTFETKKTWTTGVIFLNIILMVKSWY